MDKRKRNTRATIRFIKSDLDAEKELAISQAAAIAWLCGGFIAGFFIAQRKA